MTLSLVQCSHQYYYLLLDNLRAAKLHHHLKTKPTYNFRQYMTSLATERARIIKTDTVAFVSQYEVYGSARKLRLGYIPELLQDDYIADRILLQG